MKDRNQRSSPIRAVGLRSPTRYNSATAVEFTPFRTAPGTEGVSTSPMNPPTAPGPSRGVGRPLRSDAMALTPGTRIGAYEIIGAIGAGRLKRILASGGVG